MSKPQTTRQKLREQQRLATAFPLFAEQLAPELPELTAHVEAHGSKDMAPPPKFEVGQRVHNLDTVYNNTVYTGAVKSRSPQWSYDGRFSSWYYYLTYDEGQIPAAFGFKHELPAREERLSPAPPKVEYDPMQGIREEADGSFTDERTDITLERCERCHELDYPADDSYGLCARCIAAGHTPVSVFNK